MVGGCAGFAKNATRGVTSRTDNIKEITWVTPNMSTALGTGYYLYYSIKKGQKMPLRAYFESMSQDWVFPEQILVKADDQLFTIDARKYKRETDVRSFGSASSVYVFESYDIPIGIDYPDIAKAMCAAKVIQVRMDGRYARDINGDIFTDTVHEICALYNK